MQYFISWKVIGKTNTDLKWWEVIENIPKFYYLMFISFLFWKFFFFNLENPESWKEGYKLVHYIFRKLKFSILISYIFPEIKTIFEK